MPHRIGPDEFFSLPGRKASVSEESSFFFLFVASGQASYNSARTGLIYFLIRISHENKKQK